MSFRLKHRETIPKGVKRIVRECLCEATAALGMCTASSDADVHEARKHFRKARAALRMVRGELGAAAFNRENKSVRDASRPLSEVRDAKVLIERLDALNDLSKGRVSSDGIANLRHELVARRRVARGRTIGDSDTLFSILRQARDVRRRSKRWPLRRRGWNAIEDGLGKVYKQGKAAMLNVRLQSTDETLHEWRKRAKDLRYELELLRNICPVVMKRLAGQAHQLTNLLGEDHDLAVMRSVVREVSQQGLCIEADALTGVIDQRRRVLQVRASALGERIYKRKTKAFLRRLKRYWKGS